MPARNAAPYLYQAVDSIHRQTMPDFELILLNDGSTDDTLAQCRQWEARDARIRVIDTGGIGLVATLNLGVSESRAALIARMDADDVSAPDRFEHSATFLDSHPETGLVGSWYRVLTPSGALREIIRPPAGHAAIDAALLEGASVICHSGAMMRRDTLVALGGYRASMQHAEDYDLWLRLAEVTRLANIPRVLLHYRRHSASVSQVHREAQLRSVRAAWTEAVARRGLNPAAVSLRLAPERLVRMRHHRSLGNTLTWVTECIKGLADPQFVRTVVRDTITALKTRAD